MSISVVDTLHDLSVHVSARSRAMVCQSQIRGLTQVESGIFAERGRLLWKMKHNQWWALLSDDGGYASFDAWCSDPAQNLTPSSAHLAVQLIDLFVMFFHIKTTNLLDIGEKKCQLLVPLANKMADAIIARWGRERSEWPEVARKTWRSNRLELLGWLEDARSLSWSALYDKIGYCRNGIDTLFRGSLAVGLLRSADSIDDVLDMLGISDLSDDVVINCIVRSRVVR